MPKNNKKATEDPDEIELNKLILERTTNPNITQNEINILFNHITKKKNGK